MSLQLSKHTLLLMNRYIEISNVSSIERMNCKVIATIDDETVISLNFNDGFLEWIANCCVHDFQRAQFGIIHQDVPLQIFTMRMTRRHKIELSIESNVCYTIGRSSAVVRNHQGLYDETFSKQLECRIQLKKQLTVKKRQHRNMKDILSADALNILSPYVDHLQLAYMPEEKASHFITCVLYACRLIESECRSFFKIPKLELHAGLKGANGFYNPSSQTIGLYYKYDREMTMQLALFHEYGHLLDVHLLKKHSYKKKRDEIYKTLLRSSTLKRIQNDRSLTAEHRDYLLSIEEVIARLFESYLATKYFQHPYQKEFLFTLEESELWLQLHKIDDHQKIAGT